MKKIALVTTLGAILLGGCTREQRSPESVRQDTAAATAAAARNIKAMAQGVGDGLRRKGPVNINTADEADIAALPGMTEGMARNVVRARPYAATEDLVRRRVVTKAEYNQIVDRIVTR